MSEPTWTPGPWTVRHSKKTLYWWVSSPTGWSHFARIYGFAGTRGDATFEAKANAHLILEAFRAWFEDDSTEFARDTAFYMAKDALAKAKGEAKVSTKSSTLHPEGQEEAQEVAPK